MLYNESERITFNSKLKSSLTTHLLYFLIFGIFDEEILIEFHFVSEEYYFTWTETVFLKVLCELG